MKRVGIYSGTFDPIHEGHLAFARQAIDICGLDKLFILVEPRPRRKQGVKAIEHRVAMVQISIADDPKLGSIILEQARFTPTETLPILVSRFKGAELYMLMGDDWLSHFAEWPQVERLVRGVKFIIGLRRHDKTEVLKRLKILERTKGLKLNYQLIKVPMPGLKSSSIKQKIKKHQTPEGLTPGVLEYIETSGLYEPAAGSSEVSETYS